MFINILKSITEFQEYHSSVILTYGANLAFYEQIVLSHLWRAGSHNNIVFMDAGHYAETIEDYKDIVGYIGRRYVVAPINLGSFQSFHPKLILLLGTDRARILIGSGNLTFNGYGDNLEIFTQLDWSLKDREHQDIFSQTWKMIDEIQKRWGHSAQVSKMLYKAQARSEWLMEKSRTSDITLLHSLDTPIIDQLHQVIGSEPISKLTIFSPFLDNQAEAIRQIDQRFSPKTINLVLQSQKAVANPASLEKLKKNGTPIKYFMFGEKKRYIHAKLYLFETRKETILAVGSPNCTRSAILSNSQSGNFEILLLKKYVAGENATKKLLDYVNFKQVDKINVIQVKPPSAPLEGQKKHIYLMDISVDGQNVFLKFEVYDLPKKVSGLGLRISGIQKDIFLIDDFKVGMNDRKIQLKEKEQVLFFSRGVISASICALNGRNEVVDIVTNKLWVINSLELNKVRTFLTPNDEKAGRLLNEMTLSTDEDWRDLFESVSDLVELDLQRMQAIKRETPAQDSSAIGTKKKKENSETRMQVVGLENNQNSELSEIEAEILRENRLYAWLKIAFNQFSLINPGSSDISPKEPRAVQKRQKPSISLEKQFIGLVRKFIRALSNSEYMQTAPPFYLIAYLGIFQKIVLLLLNYKIINWEEYLKFIEKINRGFFGSYNDELPPFLNPETRNYLQLRYHSQWLDNLIHVYTFTNLILLTRRRFVHVLAEQNSIDVEQLITHTMACLSCIVHPKHFYLDEEIVDHVSDLYEIDRDELINVISISIQKYLPMALEKLKKWNDFVILNARQVKSKEEKVQLLNSRLNLSIGCENIAEHIEQTDTQVEYCSELIYICDRLKDDGLTNYYRQKLIDIYRRKGDLSLLARELIRQAKKYIFDKNYDEAIKSLLSAKTIANEISDDGINKLIDTYWSLADLLGK